MVAGSELNNRRLFWGYWFPLIVYAVIIFIQSAFPTPDSLPSFPNSDKLMHFLGYGLMGALFFRAFIKTFPYWRISRVIFFSVVLTTLYGAGDEFHQSFVAFRTADGMDLIADFIGGTFGALFFLLMRIFVL